MFSKLVQQHAKQVNRAFTTAARLQKESLEFLISYPSNQYPTLPKRRKPPKTAK